MTKDIYHSGLFPWDEFCIHFKDRKLFIGNNNRDKITSNDFSIRYVPHATEFILSRKPPLENEIVCVADYNSYIFDLEKYKGKIVYFSSYAFSPFNAFKFKKLDLIYDGIIVARNDKDKRRWLLEKLNNLKIISAAQKEEPHQPEGFNFTKQGKYNQETLCEFYNSTKCSFILSDREGECRSALESLLCGCPVISTKPKPWIDNTNKFNTLPMIGGRDEILNPSNSIYCEWSSESVLSAYEKYILNIDSYDRLSISNDAENFLFRSRIQLLKIIHHVLLNKFNANIKEVMECIKTSNFYNIYRNEIEHYVMGIC
jgi:hypothetical protein